MVKTGAVQSPALPAHRSVRGRPAVSLAKALGSSTRAGIFQHLQRSADEVTVRDVAAAFDVHPNVARTHLELLADAGLVTVGRRKNPAGGRPAKVYRVSEDTGALPPPGGDGEPATTPLLVRILTRLLDQPGGPSALPARAYEAAAAVGRRQAPDGRDAAETLEGAVRSALVGLSAHAPHGRVVMVGEGWVDVAGAADLFADVEGLRPDLADVLARGVFAGAVAAPDGPVTVAAAGTLPDGEPVWRVRPAATAHPSGPPPADTVDARGLHREAGVVRALRAVTVLQPGQVLEVLAEGPGSPAAFARWADRAGHQLLGVERVVDPGGRPAIRLLIRKGT
jgi:TusA-related sulfurtransferase/DNA-binding transcriptional ArsR family regulator